jgi:hypothetical protein
MSCAYTKHFEGFAVEVFFYVEDISGIILFDGEHFAFRAYGVPKLLVL